MPSVPPPPPPARMFEIRFRYITSPPQLEKLKGNLQRKKKKSHLIALFPFFLFTKVALNFQTAGLEMDLNDGLFRQNGCCGYVLKPDFMRDANTQFSPDKPEERQGYKPLRLSIQVLLHESLVGCNG